MDLLILDQFADYYKNKLAPKFPEASIHAVAKEEEIGDIMGNEKRHRYTPCGWNE